MVMRMSSPGAVKRILPCVNAIGVEVNVNSIVSHAIVFNYAIRGMSCAAARATPCAQRESGAKSTQPSGAEGSFKKWSRQAAPKMMPFFFPELIGRSMLLGWELFTCV